MTGCPRGLWQLAMFTSGKMLFILLCLSSAVVAQDTPGLRRLLSEAAIFLACGFICLLSLNSIYQPTDTAWWNWGEVTVIPRVALTVLRGAFLALASHYLSGPHLSFGNCVRFDSLVGLERITSSIPLSLKVFQMLGGETFWYQRAFDIPSITGCGPKTESCLPSFILWKLVHTSWDTGTRLMGQNKAWDV